MSNIFIIGNGVAGITFAKKYRKLNASDRIVIITSEKYPFYIRWQLNEFISGEKTEESLFLYNEEWYMKNRIEVMYGERVLKVDVSGKGIKTDKREYHFDKLIIASGAQSWTPPIRGSEKKGVFTLRSLNDAHNILDYIKENNVKKIIHIGGGILGLELANALKVSGVDEILVVEFMPYLLPRQLDAEGAAHLRKLLEDKGLKFITDAKTEEITGEQRAEGVVIKGLWILKSDMVLISAGVRPNMSFALECGIECGRGIKMNNQLKTNIDDIYAIGDCAEFNGRVYGIIPPAQEQANALAKIVAGRADEYNGSIMQNSLKVAGIELTSAGEINPVGDEYEFVTRKDGNTYKKAVFKDNKLVGLILLGDNAAASALLKKMKSGAALFSRKDIFN